MPNAGKIIARIHVRGVFGIRKGTRCVPYLAREGAQKFSEQYPDLKNIQEADVPQSVYDQAYKNANIDGTGPGFAVPPELQSQIIPK